jgi:hypothetical protein
MTKEIYDFIMGELGKKGMASQHYEMYEYFLEGKKNKKSLVQSALIYILIAILGGMGTLLVMGVKALI